MNIRNILSDDQVLDGIKRKSLQFFDSVSEVLFGICIYFLLLTHSFIEFFEQTRFGRDTISLYKKMSSNPLTFEEPFKK